MGAGAYVCGEETALIESLEGHRGEPRNRPPFPIDTGLPRPADDRQQRRDLRLGGLHPRRREPTGSKGIGTEKSTGYKLFSVSGDCAGPGVYEFPMGITVADLLARVGGDRRQGGADRRRLGPVRSGLASSSATIAFEDIPTGGSIIVFGPGRDMLDVAKNFLEFFVDESCGQCTPCREGNAKLLEGVEKLERGQCSMAYLQELLALGETMQVASKCGLGQSSPNAFVSIVKHFQDEIMGRTASPSHAQ